MRDAVPCGAKNYSGLVFEVSGAIEEKQIKMRLFVTCVMPDEPEGAYPHSLHFKQLFSRFFYQFGKSPRKLVDAPGLAVFERH